MAEDVVIADDIASEGSCSSEGWAVSKRPRLSSFALACSMEDGMETRIRGRRSDYRREGGRGLKARLRRRYFVMS